MRSGGFGGVEGLARYLGTQRVGALVDATHPYAAMISANAALAAATTGVPLLALRRPPWRATSGDCWIEVADLLAAVQELESLPRRVFLALGRSELAAFIGAPQHHYLIRSFDPVEPPLPVPHAIYITGRGPFAESDERALLLTHGIEVIVTKNSGGAAVYGKIAAARQLGLAVI